MVQYIELFFLEFYHLSFAMSPYLLLGFLIAGMLHVYLPAGTLNRYLGKSNFHSALNGTLFGIPLPLCSCGVIPTGVSLYKNGASKGATQSFFISTPQTGVDSVLVTWSLLGLPFALIRVVVAFITGVLGGVFTNLFDKKQADDTFEKKPEQADESFSVSCQTAPAPNRFVSMLRYAFVDFVADIAKWLLIGLLLAALMSVVVPDGFFAESFSNPFLAMLFMLAVSLPVYACSTGSVPVAAVLLLKGINPGAIFVFLMAGPATNIATMTVIAQTIGRRFLFVYLATIIVGAMFFGFLIDAFLPASWFILTEQTLGQAHLIPHWAHVWSTIIMGALLAYAVFKQVKKGFTNSIQDIEAKPALQIEVAGMSCKSCQSKIENGLLELEGIEAVYADVSTNRVSIYGSADVHLVQQKIEQLGYQFKGLIA